jgi:hypothetical protein
VPANPGPQGLTECDIRTSLTDPELAAIIRTAADEDGLTGEFYTIALHANCTLEAGHEALHAGWIATTNGEVGATCWLRWEETARYIDWLASCVQSDCLLYRGHLGGCNLMHGDLDEGPADE